MATPCGRLVADRGREARHPFLDESFVAAMLRMPLELIADLSLPPGLLGSVPNSMHGLVGSIMGYMNFAARSVWLMAKESLLSLDCVGECTASAECQRTRPCANPHSLRAGEGDKRALRAALRRLGLPRAAGRVKRAIQFGSRIGTLVNRRAVYLLCCCCKVTVIL